MEVLEKVRSDEKKYFFGRVGDDVCKVRALLKKMRIDIDVFPTIFGAPYVVFRAELNEFLAVKNRLRDVMWIEALGIRKLDLGHGEFYVSNDVQMYECQEVQQFIDPLFWMYLRGAEDVEF